MNLRTNIDSMEEEGDYLIYGKDVVIGKLVGQGQFGSVYIGKYFGDFVAVKKQICDAEVLQTYLQREINVLKKAQHDNIMSYVGAYESFTENKSEKLLCLVSEFCHGGDLLDLLTSHEGDLGWKFRINIASQAAAAIDYMHQNNIIHRDIKSSNILLDQKWHCKICDFGLAREVDLNCSDRMTLCGTNEYMAPELLFDEGNYALEVDIFSFGMVLLEIMGRAKVGHNGFAERSPRSKFQLDIESIRKLLEKDAPESLVQLALQCVDDEPCNRPTGCDVLDWIQDLYGDLADDVIPHPQLKHHEHLADLMIVELEDFTGFKVNKEDNPFRSPDISPDRSHISVNGPNNHSYSSLDLSKISKNGYSPPRNTRLSLNTHQITKLRNSESDRSPSPTTSSCYNSCASTPRASTVNTGNTGNVVSPRVVTPPRSLRTPPRNKETRDCRRESKGIKDNIDKRENKDIIDRGSKDSRDYRDNREDRENRENRDFMVFSSPDMPRKSIRSANKADTRPGNALDNRPESRGGNGPDTRLDRSDSAHTNGTISPITPSDVKLKKRSFNPFDKMDFELFDRIKFPKGGPDNKDTSNISNKNSIDVDYNDNSNDNSSKNGYGNGSSKSKSHDTKAHHSRRNNLDDCEERNDVDDRNNISDDDDDTEALVLAELMNKVQDRRKASIPVALGLTKSNGSGKDSVPAVPVAYLTPTKKDEFLRRVNHPDSGDSWGTSKASLKTSRNRTTQKNGEISPKYDGISPPRNRAISPKNGEISSKKVGNGNGDSAPKSVSSVSTISNMSMGLGSIYSKPSPFLGEWPLFSKPLGYASNEKSRLSKKYYDIGIGYSGSADNITIKSNKDKKHKDGSDENTKENDKERTKESNKSCQSSNVLSDKEVENGEVLSENELSYSDKVVFKEGNIYKKNSTGFFRNWKKVHFSITKRFMRWTSSAGLNSKYYSLKGATVIKTLQFRFQVMNLTETEGSDKYIHREFAAESYTDMDEWVKALQEAIDRANKVEETPLPSPVQVYTPQTGWPAESGPVKDPGTGIIPELQSSSTERNDDRKQLRYPQRRSKSASNLSAIGDMDKGDRVGVDKAALKGSSSAPDEFRHGADTRDARETRDVRETRDTRDIRDNRDNREIRETSERREFRESRGMRDSRETREARDTRESRSTSDIYGQLDAPRAKYVKKSNRTWKSIPESPSSSSVPVIAWLENLGLRKYENAFLSNGYDTIERIKHSGLKADMLDFLGVKDQAHRNILQSFGHCSYTDDLQIDVTKSNDYCGSVIFYTVRTSWKSHRSSISIQYNDLKDFHQNLEKLISIKESIKTEKEKSCGKENINGKEKKDDKEDLIAKSMPSLPDPKLFNLTSKVQDTEGTLAYDSEVISITAPLRHQVLQSYLRQLAGHLEGSTYLNPYLQFLDLINTPKTKTEITETQK